LASDEGIVVVDGVVFDAGVALPPPGAAREIELALPGEGAERPARDGRV